MTGREAPDGKGGWSYPDGESNSDCLAEDQVAWPLADRGVAHPPGIEPGAFSLGGSRSFPRARGAAGLRTEAHRGGAAVWGRMAVAGRRCIPTGSRTPLAGVKARSPGRWRTGTWLRARGSNPGAVATVGRTHLVPAHRDRDRAPEGTRGFAGVSPAHQAICVVPARAGFRGHRPLVPGLVLGAWWCRDGRGVRWLPAPHREGARC